MTSYKLTPNVKFAMQRETQRLLGLRTSVMERNFPLDYKDIIGAILPAEAVECFDKLAKYNASSRPRTRYIFGIVQTGEDIPHPALIQVFAAADKKFDYLWDAQVQSYHATGTFDASVGKRSSYGAAKAEELRFDVSTLSGDSRKKFVKWFNAAVRERRICAVVERLVNEFVLNHCTSTTELNQRWRGLRTVFAKLPDPWPERMRNVGVTRYKRMNWNADGNASVWYEANKHKMAIAEGILAAAGAMDVDTTKSHVGPGGLAAMIARIVEPR